MQRSDAVDEPDEATLLTALHEILKDANFDTVSTKVIIANLENKFKCSLSSKRQFIKNSVNEYVTNFCIEPSEHQEVAPEDDEEPRNTETIKKRGGGFSAPVQLSTELANFMGTEMAPRTAVTKTIWVYIKANNLQNPADKREIICDAKMEQLFRKKRFNMFKMTKYLSEMMKSYDDLQSHPVSAAIGIEKKKAAPLKRERVEISACKTDSKKPLKKVKGTHHVASKSNTGGLNKPMELSKPLATLLGVVQESRCQVVARLWKYIKDNNLQNPEDKRTITLDAKMRAVFHQEQMTGFSMNKFLSPHLSKIE